MHQGPSSGNATYLHFGVGMVQMLKAGQWLPRWWLVYVSITNQWRIWIGRRTLPNQSQGEFIFMSDTCNDMVDEGRCCSRSTHPISRGGRQHSESSSLLANRNRGNHQLSQVALVGLLVLIWFQADWSWQVRGGYINTYWLSVTMIIHRGITHYEPEASPIRAPTWLSVPLKKERLDPMAIDHVRSMHCHDNPWVLSLRSPLPKNDESLVNNGQSLIVGIRSNNHSPLRILTLVEGCHHLWWRVICPILSFPLLTVEFLGISNGWYLATGMIGHPEKAMLRVVTSPTMNCVPIDLGRWPGRYGPTLGILTIVWESPR